MNVSQKIAKGTVRFLSRHSPLILTCVSAAGVAVTAVLTAQATPKAVRLLEEAEDKKGEELTKSECVKTAWTCYIPAAAVGITTILCIFGANYLSRRQSAALVGAYAMLGKSYDNYRSKVRELYGDEVHNKVMEALAVERAKEINIYAPSYAYNSQNGFAGANEEERLFYEPISRRYFQSTISRVLQAEYHLNRNFVLDCGATKNDYYDFLGLDEVEHGDDVGWSPSDGIGWIDFNHTKAVMDDGLECYIIDCVFEPTPIDW